MTKRTKKTEHKEIENNAERSKALRILNETKLKHQMKNKGKREVLVSVDNKTSVVKWVK